MILEQNGKELIIMGNKAQRLIQPCLFSMVLSRMAGEDFTKDIKDGKTIFLDSPFYSEVKMIETMCKDCIISKKSLETVYEDVAYHFANNESAYFIDGDWRTSSFIKTAVTPSSLLSKERQENDINLMLFPSLPKQCLSSSVSGNLSQGYAISSSIESGSEKEKAAWEIIKWLSGPTCQQRRLDTGTSYPSLVRGVDYSNLEPLSVKRANLYSSTTEVTPVFDSVFSVSVSSVLNAKLYELGMGGVTAIEVCEAVQAAYDAE